MLPRPLRCLFWGCLLVTVHLERTTACAEHQYERKGLCCDLCQPGEKLVADCTDSTDTQCATCGKGEFQAALNKERYCHQHKYCDPHLGLRVLTNGTLRTDTTCMCVDGQHCSSDACESCYPNTACPLGFGVKYRATGVFDTICEPCPVGFFSNVSSALEKCYPWTRGQLIMSGDILVITTREGEPMDIKWVETKDASSTLQGNPMADCETKGLVEMQAGTNRTDVVCGFGNRLRTLLVVPIIMGTLLVVLLLFVFIKKVVKKPDEKVAHIKHAQDPEETEDSPPVQETLHGCQPVTQEDGKESRISVQERL